MKSYGQLLGEYFSIVSTIAQMETELGPERLEGNEPFLQLLERREEVREQLDATAESKVDSDIQELLDEAFMSTG